MRDDPKRFTKRGNAKTRNPWAVETRCVECGTLLWAEAFTAGILPIGCPAHPDSPVFDWPSRYQAAAIYATQRVAQMGKSLEAQLEEVEGIAETLGSERASPRLLATFAVLPELIRWGGLPERRTDHLEKPKRGLYG